MIEIMKTFKLVGIGAALLLTVAISSTALAQGAGQAGGARSGGARGGGQGRGGGGGAAPTLSNLPLPYLASTLNLTDDQKTKIEAIQAKVRTDTADLRKPDASGQRPNRAELQPKIAALNDQAKKDIEAVLTPAQAKAADKALTSARVYSAVGIPLPVVADLKLTSAEDAKLAAIIDESTKEQAPAVKALADARTAGDQAKVQELGQTMQTSRQATRDKAMAVLTEEQKATLAQYQKDHPRGNRGARQGAAPAAPPPA
jgi:Spy/CpxP family protein refolding chaperone